MSDIFDVATNAEFLAFKEMCINCVLIKTL